jgi:hypothetical protein
LLRSLPRPTAQAVNFGASERVFEHSLHLGGLYFEQQFLFDLDPIDIVTKMDHLVDAASDLFLLAYEVLYH